MSRSRSRRTADRIWLKNPINRKHSLAQHLMSMWTPLKGLSGGKYAYDLMGKNHGTLTGGVTLSPSAPAGLWGSWALNGTTGYISGNAGNLPNSASLIVVFRATALSGQQTIFGFFDGASVGNLLTVETNGTTLTTNGRFPSNNYLNFGTIAVGEWHVAEIVFEKDGSGFMWRTLYLDGLQVVARTFLSGTFSALPYFCAGRNYAWASFQQFFNGNVAMAAMFPYLQSSPQASQLYKQTRLGFPGFFNRIKSRTIVTIPAGIVNIFASFGLESSAYFLNNSQKTISTTLSTDNNIDISQVLNKYINVSLTTLVDTDFTLGVTKTSPISLSTELSSQFKAISTTVLTAPQISFSLEQGLLLYPTLTSLLNSPKIYLSIDNNIQLSQILNKYINLSLITLVDTDFVLGITKTSPISLSLDQSTQLTPTSTKTITGVGLGTELSSNLVFSNIKTVPLILGYELSSQFNQPNITKTTVVGLSTDLGVFIGGWTKSTVVSASFGINLSSQFTTTSPSILDTSPSTFCFTMYIMKELDSTMYINKESDFTGYITKELDSTMQLKNKC